MITYFLTPKIFPMSPEKSTTISPNTSAAPSLADEPRRPEKRTSAPSTRPGRGRRSRSRMTTLPMSGEGEAVAGAYIPIPAEDLPRRTLPETGGPPHLRLLAPERGHRAGGAGGASPRSGGSPPTASR
jgi:hypothetical protein